MKQNKLCISKRYLLLALLSAVGISLFSLYASFSTRLSMKSKSLAAKANETAAIITGKLTFDFQTDVDMIGVGIERKKPDGSWETVSPSGGTVKFNRPKTGNIYDFSIRKLGLFDKELERNATFRINAYVLSKGAFVGNQYVTFCSGSVDAGRINTHTCTMQAPGKVDFLLTDKAMQVTPTISLKNASTEDTKNIITGNLTLKFSTNPESIGVGIERLKNDGSWEPLSPDGSSMKFNNPKTGTTYKYNIAKLGLFDKGLDPYAKYRITAYALSKGVFHGMGYVTFCSGTVDLIETGKHKCLLQAPGKADFLISDTAESITPTTTLKSASTEDEDNIISGMVTADFGFSIDSIGVGLEKLQTNGSWEALPTPWKGTIKFTKPKNNVAYSFKIESMYFGEKGLDPYASYRVNAYALQDGRFVGNRYVKLCSGKTDANIGNEQKCVIDPPGHANFLVTDKVEE